MTSRAAVTAAKAPSTLLLHELPPGAPRERPATRSDMSGTTQTPRSPAEWTRVLMKYRTPILSRSLVALTATILPFLLIWTVAWLLISVSPWLSLCLALLNAGFLVRIFLIQHDCGHAAFFGSRALNDWTGRILGVLTLTPYDVWRRTHAIHHSTTGNLDRRGVGDIPTMTVSEFQAKSRLQRIVYRALRNPLFLFGIAPFYIFFLQNRLPVGLMRSGRIYWASALLTNAGMAGTLALLWIFGGLQVILLIFLPTTLFASSIGMWLFYVQHQFEDTEWDHEPDWVVQNAALHGSSYYVLPPVLNWFTANIGAHHVHHLASRIPFYRLSEVLREHDMLAGIQRITLLDSLRCARLHLWDEDARRLVTFAEAKA